MTRDPKTVSPDAAAADHIGMFDKHRFNHIPVVANDGEIVGIVSRKDIENYFNLMKLLNEDGRRVKIRDIMTSPVFSYFDTVSVKDVAAAMIDNNIHAVIIVDRNEKLAGIVTSTDILRVVADRI